MNVVQRIVKNTGVLFISQVVSYVLGFFYLLYIARYLGAEGFGILSFALAFTGIFAVFIDLGLSTLTVREISKDRSLTGKYFLNTLIIKTILAILTSILAILILIILGYSTDIIQIVYIILLSVIFNSFSIFLYSIFQAFELMELQSIANILNTILMFVGVILLISKNVGVLEFALLYLITSFIVLIFNQGV